MPSTVGTKLIAFLIVAAVYFGFSQVERQVVTCILRVLEAIQTNIRNTFSLVTIDLAGFIQTEAQHCNFIGAIENSEVIIY